MGLGFQWVAEGCFGRVPVTRDFKVDERGVEDS